MLTPENVKDEHKQCCNCPQPRHDIEKCRNEIPHRLDPCYDTERPENTEGSDDLQ